MGHVLRMKDGRITKAVVQLQAQLEEWKKAPRKKRKTVLYRKKLVNEVGWDAMIIDRVASDRKLWKSIVSRQMEHLERYYEMETGEERLEMRSCGAAKGSVL